MANFRQLLTLQLETERFRVEREGTRHVFDLISNTVKATRERCRRDFLQIC